MANDLSRRPWILDTASASPVKTGLTWTSGFVFRDYANAAHKAVFKDSRGIVICELLGNAGLTPSGEAWFIPQVIKDLTLSQLDSGVVEVIVK